MITEVHQEGRFYRLSTGRAAHYENIKPHNPSTEDWCIPADMEEGDYLMMDPACEVNEKGTREKNDGKEVVEEGTDTPLDLDPNEQIEAEDETLLYAEEDWQDPEQIEVPKTSHLILGDSLVRVLSNLRTSWVTTVMAFGGATIAQLYRMAELMNPGRIPNVMILVGTNDISRGSDEQEAIWESMMVCCLRPSGRNSIARY